MTAPPVARTSPTRPQDAIRLGRCPQATAPTDLHERIVAAAGGHGHGPPVGTGGPAWPRPPRWSSPSRSPFPTFGGGMRAPAPVRTPPRRSIPPGRKRRAWFPPKASRRASRTGITARKTSSNSPSRLARTLCSSAQEDAPTSEIADPAAAIRCVARATQEGATGRLTRLIQARFEGRDAYIAVYLEGPGADEQPGLVALWVAARDNCSFLSLAFSQK